MPSKVVLCTISGRSSLRHICVTVTGPSWSPALLARPSIVPFEGSVFPPFLNSHSPLQVGGLPKYPVQMVAQAARLFASLHRRGNAFLLFLDLREAFYRVARLLVVNMGHTVEDTARNFSELRLPPEAHEAFQRSLAGDTATEHAGTSAWMQALFREMLSNTWFRLPHQPDVVVTDLGTRPGDSLADLLFSYLFAVVLDKARCSLLTEGFDLQVAWSQDMRGSIQASVSWTARGWTTCVSWLPPTGHKHSSRA